MENRVSIGRFHLLKWSHQLLFPHCYPRHRHILLVPLVSPHRQLEIPWLYGKNLIQMLHITIQTIYHLVNISFRVWKMDFPLSEYVKYVNVEEKFTVSIFALDSTYTPTYPEKRK